MSPQSPLHSTIAYIAIGSNEGERIIRCDEAVAALAKLPQTAVSRRSAWYETEPVIDPAVHQSEGRPSWFINGVVELETGLSPLTLFHQCLRIEQKMGRMRHHPEEPGEKIPLSRPIDLDLLLHGDAVLNSEELTLPHPRFHQRRFVLAPLAELAPTLEHPTLRLTMAALLDRLSDPHQVALTPAVPHP